MKGDSFERGFVLWNSGFFFFFFIYSQSHFLVFSFSVSFAFIYSVSFRRRIYLKRSRQGLEDPLILGDSASAVKNTRLFFFFFSFLSCTYIYIQRSLRSFAFTSRSQHKSWPRDGRADARGGLRSKMLLGPTSTTHTYTYTLFYINTHTPNIYMLVLKCILLLLYCCHTIPSRVYMWYTLQFQQPHFSFYE